MSIATISEIEQAITAIVKGAVPAAVVRDASFDFNKQNWWSVLVPENQSGVHAWVVSLVEYVQAPKGAGNKVVTPMFGVDLLKQYDLAGASRSAFYAELERVADALTLQPTLGLAGGVIGHDELQGKNIGTRTIGGVRLHVLPATLVVRLQPKTIRPA